MEDEGCPHYTQPSRSTQVRRARAARKVSALEPFEDGVEPFRTRSAFAYREINHGQSETSLADSIQSNAGIPLCFLSRDGCGTSPRFKKHAFGRHHRAVLRGLSPGELRRIRVTRAHADFRHQRFR